MNKKENVSVAVQIGLADVCELKYLADPNWRNIVNGIRYGDGKIESIHHGDSTHFLPQQFMMDAFDNDSWVVYGVDADLSSIEQVQSASGHIENLHIWDRFVSTPDNDFANLFLGGKITDKKVTLYELLWDIQTHAEAPIDFLFVDIDTGELDVFMNYNFLIKPMVVHIEAHTLGIATQLLHKFLEKGYILIQFSDTHNTSGSDVTMKFIRKKDIKFAAHYYLKPDHEIKMRDHFFEVEHKEPTCEV